jgi:transcriptional regulator GlxA family with amidase domain
MLAHRLTGTAGRDCTPADDWRVRAVIEMLEQNYQRRLPVGELASAVNLSASRLDSLFRQCTGSPPSTYLKLLRLQRGKTLLETTFQSVKEIAACVGFNDAGRFVKEFKTRYGQPPGRWRRTFRAAAEGAGLS